jgi:ribosomal protein L11 methyltransferase
MTAPPLAKTDQRASRVGDIAALRRPARKGYEESMSQNWKVTALAPRAVIQAALLAHEEVLDWDPELVLSGSEIAGDRPDEWRLEVYLPRRPGGGDLAAIRELFAQRAPELTPEQLPAVDWVTESQTDLEPIRAGRFHVHTPEHPPLSQPGVTDFVIPASQAFGTGQHSTTAGCLEMLTRMKRSGLVARNLADIGTGTGLLGFAALALWPRALATLSDIDPVCRHVVAANAALNFVQLGSKPGQALMVVAEGMDHPVLQVRAPYDLIVANILAGPLIELAPQFSRALIPGGSLLLSGLLESQEPQVRTACRRAGLRLAARLVHGDWSVLWLRKRPAGSVRGSRPRSLPDWARRW